MLISIPPFLCKALKIQKALAIGVFLWYNGNITREWVTLPLMFL